MKRSHKWVSMTVFAFFVTLLLHNSISSRPLIARKASRLTPEILLSRLIPHDVTTIPKILHQSWSDTDLPAKFHRWSETCRSKNPGWEWVLWTDNDNRNLVKQYFEWFLPTYDKLPGPIYQADVVRNIYMYIYGGVYADLDMECLRPYNEMFSNYNQTTISYPAESLAHSPDVPDGTRRAYFGRMGTDNNFGDSIPNAWMAATPGHPFFLFQLKELERYIAEGGDTGIAEHTTGPVILRYNLGQYDEHYSTYNDDTNKKLDETFANVPTSALFSQGHSLPHSINILPHYYIYPYSWHRDGDGYREFCWASEDSFNPTRCKLLLGTEHWPSYTITYWSHTWQTNGHDESKLEKIQEDLTSRRRSRRSLRTT